MTTREKQLAKIAAIEAQTADARGDVVARDRAIVDLWGAAGYWRQTRTTTTAEFRGEIVPPKMVRMPAGRSLPWARRWDAVDAWAASN